MARYDLSKYTLYRLRYVIGYTVIGLLLAGVLLFAGLFLPGGLSENEMASVVQSHGIEPTKPLSFAMTDMPYHAFQAGIIGIFGISTLAVKAPSLILALLSAVGIIVLLRRWFRDSIAVLGSLIAVSNSHFLFIAQSGTPDIMYIFWPVALLLLGTQITRMKQWRFLWKILFSIAAALSLYTPLSIYVLFAIALSVLLHPHLRSIIRRLSKKRMAIVSFLFILFSAPLAYFLAKQPSLATQLLGISIAWPPAILDNLRLIAEQYFLFWKPNVVGAISPVFGLGTVILMLFGAYRIVLTRATTRSYLIIIWFLCLVPVLLLSPLYTAATFVPSVLLLTAGLQSLISYWYRLFPRNPYARTAGMIPIVILVSAFIALGLARYAYGYHYSPVIVPQFSKDLQLLPADTTSLQVSDKERPFWNVVDEHRPQMVITDTPTEEFHVVSRDAYSGRAIPGYTLYRIVTSSLTNDADRFYIYQNTRN